MLADVRSEATDQGGGLSHGAITAITAYRRQAAFASWVVLSAAGALFIVTLIASTLYLRDPRQIRLVAGGLGVTLGGALVALRATWKDWSEANLLLALIDEASDAQIQSLIDRLIKKF
jgi:hypothetical protein